jgi:UDP-2,4-diacetamido-2,4,6-trideoxy-beta-L-altropyranose hydrolase
MKIVFRVDASTVMGTGHVMRCRTLATALKKQGAKIQFVTRAHPGHLGDMLARDGFAVTLLPLPEIKIDDLACKEVDYLAWLGVSQQQDALQCIRALENQPCDWLIVDHYGLDYNWEKQLQPHTHKLMVIDDLANRTHVCDVLLDQNYTLAGEERYRPKVPAPCQLLLGPRYALLRPEYAQYRETMVPHTGEIRRILVFLGGADNGNITGMVLAALSAVRLAHLEVDVVIGANFIHKSCVTAQATARPNTRIHGPRPHLADLMAKADLAIGAGGATTWERLCMGLPSLVVGIADNQMPACEALKRDGLILFLGSAFGLDVDLIESALTKILIESVKLQELATKSQTLVDGRGTNRVAETLIPTPAANLRLRPANAGDALTYFSWVNDPVVRSSANNSGPIDLGTHMHWFDKRLMDLNSYLYVLEAGDLPIGQVRFECHDEEATIDYSLDVLVRRRGWANQLLKMGIEALNSSRPMQLCAQVKAENLASVATFIRLGFVEQITESREGGGDRHFRLLSSLIKTVGSTIGCPNGYKVY